ncbi:MAG: pilus assembly protein PilP [Myxococcales bacterium]|jgi:type IV pilus assembly protein PilP|nr:pilus assembly protein PilP [Myxococcales bacterium]
MSTRAIITALGAATLVFGAFTQGCGDSSKSGSGNKSLPAMPATAAPATAAAGTAAAGVADGGAAPPPPSMVRADYSEADFAENDRNRDPFRTFVATAGPEGPKIPVRNQRAVVLSQYAVDELKLVAIVTGGDYPRAMVLDPQSKGWVLKRGDFVGRSEVVHTGGTNGTDYQLNWRVDRVREGEMVLIREDPAQPGIPPVTRVIALHPEGEKTEKLEN